MTPILLFLFGLTLMFVGIAAAGILWAIKDGQFDDLDGPAQRILMDDDDPLIPFNTVAASNDEKKASSNLPHIDTAAQSD